ncbi:alkaline phosphatase D family protein [Pseudonocardia hispaniensis]|uniref:Alkaline phosphatase D family protein n=1 Tax=Pseudonocardia hispaniensis TaxID=904933 RepID=A0ABW1J7Y3_9PSEU
MLRWGAVGVAGLLTGGALPGCTGHRRADPFTLGVASGEPNASGVVLWTRLAPDPLAEDGFGGMGPAPVEVEWELAGDESFRRVYRRGVETAVRESAHSVHVELDELAPGREYFYRFRTGPYLSAPGRTRTAPEPGAPAGPLTICVASCAQYEHGYFTAYRHLAHEQPDLVLHLGDYQYEYAADEYVAPGGNVRCHAGPQTLTLSNYRQRYAQYKTDPDLQAAHAAAPWLVVWDDHEVANNWAGEIPEPPRPGFPARRAAAFQAYYENMPLRRRSAPRGSDLRLYRRIGWGDLASFFMLDTRQYRDDQPCGGRAGSDCPERADPDRTILGRAQEAWLLNGLRGSRTRWNLLGQQVLFARLDLRPGAERRFSADAWDGYLAARERIIAALRDSPERNTMILTGDLHRHCAAEITEHVDDPASATVATELVTTSITSEGDGSQTEPTTAAILADNPHIRFYDNRRGYVRTDVRHGEIRGYFRVIPYVSRPGAPVATQASFVVENGRPALHRV